LAVRLFGMLFSPLEYDEIWSLENFSRLPVGRILTDLALPNNHPLNSLCIKAWLVCFTEPQSIRIHSLVFGVLAVALSGVLARALLPGGRINSLFTMLFLALDAPAIYYSGLARGYSAQLCFLLLFACGVAWSGRLRRFLPGRWLPEAAMVVGAVGAVLSLPSAPIFLVAVMLCGRIYRRERPAPSVMLAAGIAAALVVGYLAWNYSALRRAQSWGVRLADLTEWGGFIAVTLIDYISFGILPFLIVFAGCDRRRGLLLLFCTALILGSAAFVGAGPSRVYLPLSVIVALGCSRGAHVLFTAARIRGNRKLARILIVATAALAALGFYQQRPKWEVVDYWGWFRAGRAMPENCFTVYPAAAGYPLMWNNHPEAVDDHYARLMNTAPGMRSLWCLGVAPGRINGLDARGSEAERRLAVRGTGQELNGFAAVEYRLRPVEAPPAGESFLLALPPAPETRLAALTGALHAGGIDTLSLNPWFNLRRTDAAGIVYSGRLLYGVAPKGAATGVWRTAREAGARFYAFLPDAPAR
ncbi:MAG: hypothetical protein IJJ28_05875, partial [Lentisphaeria bacterium]|nr:hypothetical protein [Lentisphaeria bacterium]